VSLASLPLIPPPPSHGLSLAVARLLLELANTSRLTEAGSLEPLALSPLTFKTLLDLAQLPLTISLSAPLLVLHLPL
jgi:hypothetical protein